MLRTIWARAIAATIALAVAMPVASAAPVAGEESTQLIAKKGKKKGKKGKKKAKKGKKKASNTFVA